MIVWLAACTSGSLPGTVPDDVDDPPPTPPSTVVEPWVETATVPSPPRVLINELVSSNRAGPADDAGGTPDWIELYNPSDVDFSLAGLTMSDVEEEPDKHVLDPSLVVPAGGFLLLWADGQPEQGPDHLSFELSSDGDDVGLFDGGFALSHVAFGPLLEDASLARSEDGGVDFVVTLQPTPGATNGSSAAELGPSDAARSRRCDPVVTVADPTLLEGEELAMGMACATGEDPEALGLQTLTRAVGPTVDGTDVTWATGLQDAGTVDVLYVVDDPDRPGVPETARGTAWVADAWRDPANVPVDPSAYRSEWGLPVLHLDPAGPVDQVYVDMDAWYDGEPYTGTMKIRGASSASYPKKSYTLEFEPEQIDLGEPLGRKDHLVLISNFDDSAYVRQKLVYDTWAALGEASGETRLLPRTAFVVVYLSGTYLGLYTAIDHIDDELAEEYGFDPAGDVFKSVNHDANFYLTNASGWPKTTLHDGWEKKEGLPADDFSAIEDLTAFVATSDHATFDAEADAWIDRNEFMDWFTLVHWTSSDDSAGKNAYLYVDPATGLYRYVPWDFNHSFGQNWYTARTTSTAYNDFISRNGVFWHLQEDPGMAAALDARFDQQRQPGGPFDPAVLLAQMDAYYDVIEPSCSRDWDRWEDDYWSYFGWARTDRNSFEDERAYLEAWIAERAVYMDSVH